MDDIAFVPLLVFIFVTVFTPGPNNITSTTIGINYGYKKTFPFLLGLTSAYVITMAICAFIASTVSKQLPGIVVWVRYVGAFYILWLAYKNLHRNYDFSDDQEAHLGFTNGIILQFLNPKVFAFGLTIYSSFLISLSNNNLWLITSAFILALTGFIASLTWAIGGALIRNYLMNRKIKNVINIILSLLLVYTAIEMAGIV